MFEIILIIILIIFIKSFVGAYKKTGSFKGAMEYLKKINSNFKKSTETESSVFEDVEEEEEEESKATQVTRELTKNETKYLSSNVKFLSSLFIAASLINLSVNLDRQIYLEILDINIYTWYISIFFLVIATFTFLKSNASNKNGKILLVEGKAEIFGKSNIVYMGSYTVTIPNNWYIKDGKNVSIEGYETSPGRVIALNFRNYSVDGSNLKKRGKWIILSLFLFINLFISGLIYEGGLSLSRALAVYGITSESLIVDDYEKIDTKSFKKGQYIEVNNIDSVIVNNMVHSYRVLLPNSNGIKLELSKIYYRLEKLKELQGTIMFNSLYYHHMDKMDFSFSNDFNKDDFTLFLDNNYFSNALDEWDAYLNSELWVDIPLAQSYLRKFIGSQVEIIKDDLKEAIDEAVNRNNFIKFYPMVKNSSFELQNKQLFIKFFNEPFKPEFNLDGYNYIKEIEDKFTKSEKVSFKFFFRGLVGNEQPTHLKTKMIEKERDLLIIYYRAGIFTLSLLLYLIVVGVSISIKKSNRKVWDY